MDIAFVNVADVKRAQDLEEVSIVAFIVIFYFQLIYLKFQLNEKEAREQDREELKLIAKFPESSEKRVISFGLYGGNPKYIVGAQKNVVLAKQYFPGWICRYYITSDVATEVVEYLKEQGAEIFPIPSGM